MATLLVLQCIKSNKQSLIPFAVIIGFGFDLLIASMIAKMLGA